MGILSDLETRWFGVDDPFLIIGEREISFADIKNTARLDLREVKSGDVVALVGDFEPVSIIALLELLEIGAVVVPLTKDTKHQHDYFFESASVEFVIEDGVVNRIERFERHPLIEKLTSKDHAGLVLFSSGTTGHPKAILHDFTNFKKRYSTIRPTLRTLNFLLFDHIGGINTLLHTLYNRGLVVAPQNRTVDKILNLCRFHEIELLPTTPTFLRMLLMSGACERDFPESIKVITYGTERMDQSTLTQLCQLLPDVDFRQTFGMSELGILRVKSELRDSLFMSVGGEGVETKVENQRLFIRSQSRMMGYLNADSPFDSEGWYDTKDLVELKGEYIKVVGRDSDIINVGGLKFMAADVESFVLKLPGVKMAKAVGAPNPITGQHVALTCELDHTKTSMDDIKSSIEAGLPRHMQPKRYRSANVKYNHRFKLV